ncbi:MAG: helix-turn-helix transcriptional regulator [Clostridia bacterium]|nr:helix-turn-helix transcriptional regulator [Clostridia bacterium]
MSEAIQEIKQLYDGVEFPIECLSFTKCYRSDRHPKPHYHDYIEFLFGLSPCGVTAEIDGKRVTLSEGDLLIVNSEVPHCFFYDAPCSNYLCIKATPETIYSPGNSTFDVKYILPFLQTHLHSYQLFKKQELEGTEVKELLLGMIDEWEKKEYGYEVALKRSILSLFLWMIRKNHAKASAEAEASSAVSGDHERLIRRSLEYIERHYADINETQAAEQVNLSYSYYSKLFRRVMGKNFNEYLLMIRIRAAEHLLLSGDLNITEIALATGFSSSSHFIEKFRRHKGITPKQYRIAHGRK